MKILNRLTEPSTWASIAAVLVAFGVGANGAGLIEEAALQLIAAGSAVAGAIGFFRKDPGSPE